MYIQKTARVILLLLVPATVLLSSCYKEEIQFGNDLTDSHTQLVNVDTISPVISTYVLDSFPTSGNNLLLAGRCEDSLMGITTAKAYFQVGLPSGASTALPEDAVYDSLVLILKPNKTFYGDTAVAQNFVLYELAAQPDYTYANRLYNTSSVPVLPTPLASFTRTISPQRGTDSLVIRLPDSKGRDFFSKINALSEPFSSENFFLQYFKGMSLQTTGNTNGAVFGFGADSSLQMKLYYHVSIPSPEQRELVFPFTQSSYQFNQVLTDRTGTLLATGPANQHDFPATAAYPFGLTQSGTGVLMKIRFPTLRTVLQADKVVRLLSAELILKPVAHSFDYGGFRLPPTLFLSETDATNSIGYPITNNAGTTLTSSPFIDEIYQEDTHYSFNVTSYVNYLMTTTGTTESGVFVMQENPATAKLLDRLKAGSREHPAYRTQLSITLLTVN